MFLKSNKKISHIIRYLTPDRESLPWNRPKIRPSQRRSLNLSKLSRQPTSGVAFLQYVYPGSVPAVLYRLGFAANDGCGGSGMYGTVGVAINSYCDGQVDTATGGYSYPGILGDAAAWHHYALVWNQDGLPAPVPTGRRAAVFLDGVMKSTYWIDQAGYPFPNPANYPNQVFGLIATAERQGTVAIDNLIIRDYAKLDFSDRFQENPVNQPPVDSTAPTLSLPDPPTVEATGPNGATVTYSVSATDNLDPAPVVHCAPESGSTFALGNTVVNCTATDASGNSSQGSFSVSVRDTTPPQLTLPADLTVEGDTGGGANVTLPAVTASDIVDTSPTVACDHASGFFPLGNTVVNCTASDASSNSSQGGGYLVHVVDTRAPFLRMNRVSAPQYGWLAAETFRTFPARVGTTPVGLEARALDLVGIGSVAIAGKSAVGGPEFWTIDNLALTEGSNLLTALATDLAGNQTTANGAVLLNLDLDEDRIRNDVDRQPKLPSYEFSDQFTAGLGRGPIDVAVSPDGTRALCGESLFRIGLRDRHRYPGSDRDHQRRWLSLGAGPEPQRYPCLRRQPLRRLPVGHRQS